MSEEQLAKQIIKDIVEGWENTDIRCGVIGEVGCVYPLTG